jgi:tRNA-specific 2-thiouridylase
VTRIDARKNAIYIGAKENVYRRIFTATDLNFIPFDALKQTVDVTAKVRYFSPLSQALVEPVSHNQVKVAFKEPQWAITPGQSVVFYQEDSVVGGGIINAVLE